MDKVDPATASLLKSTFYPNLKPEIKKARDKEEIRKNRRLRFAEILERSASAGELGPLRELIPSEEALTELMDAVHSAGSDLKDRPFPDEILRYKKAVRNFVHYVVENSYAIENKLGLIKDPAHRVLGNKKKLILVNVIDKKLEELAAAILSGQTNQLMRVSKLDEITGLLVDLTITGMIKERDE